MTLRGRHELDVDGGGVSVGAVETRRALTQGIVTEALNPKTALFFLAFLPQFIDPSGGVVAQFLLLGAISVTLNTTVDLVVAYFAGPLGQWLRANPRWRELQRRATGWALIGLGAYVALGDSRRS